MFTLRMKMQWNFWRYEGQKNNKNRTRRNKSSNAIYLCQIYEAIKKQSKMTLLNPQSENRNKGKKL